jgi:hypothetical protein
MSAHPCVQHFEPRPNSYGGCLPCTHYVRPEANNDTNPLYTDLQVSAHNSRCIHCLLQSGQPFLVGRPGMGAPEEVGCAVATGNINVNGSASKHWTDLRKTLKTLNGILTRSNSDALEYARCYVASINRSDLIVRLGGGTYMPLRKPLTMCARPGSHHHQKADVMIAQAGHFPGRVISDRGLNPWFFTAYQGKRMRSEEQLALLRDVHSWTAALAGRTVLVVHPFNHSIVHQLARGSRAVWGPFAELVMPPGIRFKVVTAPQNLAKAVENADWKDALDTLIDRVDAAGQFDLALISCGGLGMLLGAYLRSTNRCAQGPHAAAGRRHCTRHRPPRRDARHRC